MTKIANDGRDKPFSDWLRKHPRLDSIQAGLDVTDVDFIFHKYKSNVDGEGTRDVKLMFDVEVKTYGGKANPSQSETLFFRHQLLNKRGKKLYSPRVRDKVTVWHFGQFILVIKGGNRPDLCKEIKWGIFGPRGEIKFNVITEPKLVDILGFNIRPDNFDKLTLRRHHKTREYGYEVREGYLFPMAKSMTQRS